MIAKQAVVSASLVVWLGGATGTAIADPDAPPEPAASEVSVETNDPACASEAPPPSCAEPERPPLEPDKPTGTFSVGAGFSSDESFIATARVAQDNLFHTGSSLSLNAKLSAREQMFLMRFVDPKVLGSDLTLAADVYSTRRDFAGFARQAAGGSLMLSHPLGDHLLGFVGYRLEHVEVETDASVLARGVGAVDDLQLGGGLLSSVRAGIAYDDRDNPMRPRHGTAAGAMIEVADRRLGSDIELARASGWLNHHRSLGPFTLHLGGTITGVTSRDPRGVPLSERLQLDGSGDIRGYAPGSLGPFDRRTGIALGGNLKATGRVELELPLFRSLGISAAGFLDAGGIYDLDGRGGMGTSAGFGLIWDSPIGPLRFDWAIPLDGGKPRFLFSIGASF